MKKLALGLLLSLFLIFPATAKETTTRVYVLLGGLVSTDAVLTSNGMLTIPNELKPLHVTTLVYQWGNFGAYYRDIMKHYKTSRIAIIGFSGGGMSATYLANAKPRPLIDLIITLDASPAWNMKPLQANVLRAVDYHNNLPLLFGLGGGRLVGRQVKTIEISEPHLLVQYDPNIHKGIYNEIGQLTRRKQRQ